MYWHARKARSKEETALLEYWDDVVLQQPAMPVPPSNAPNTLGAIVRGLHTAEQSDASGPPYQEQLLLALLAQYEEIDAKATTTATTPPLPRWSLPRVSKPAQTALPPLRKMLSPAFEIAMITLLILASVAGIWLANDRRDDPSVIAPGVATPGTPEATPGAPVATLETQSSAATTVTAEFRWQIDRNDPSLDLPGDLAVAPDGTLWIVDRGVQQVRRFDPDGTLIESLEGLAGGDTFEETGSDLRAIAVDADGNLLIADHATSQVMRLGQDGTLLDEWGGKGDGAGQFEQAGDLAIDSLGNVYVLDITLNRIQKFAPDGVYLATIGATGEGTLTAPGEMGIDTRDNLYVPDATRVVVFAPDGAFLRGFGEDTLDFAAGVAVDPGGRLFVADAGQSRVQAYDQTGQVIGAWGEFGGNPGDFNFPQALGADEAGHVYVIDYGNGSIQSFLIVPAAEEASPAA